MKSSKQHKYLAAFLLSFFIATLVPSTLKKIRVVHVTKQLTIQTMKLEPPRLAFELIAQNTLGVAEDNQSSAEPSVKLNEFIDRGPWNVKAAVLNKKIEGNTIHFSREEALENLAEKEWIQELSPHLRKRLLLADQKSEILAQNERRTPALAQERATSSQPQKQSALSDWERATEATKPSPTEGGGAASPSRTTRTTGQGGIWIQGRVSVLGAPIGNRKIIVAYKNNGSRQAVKTFDSVTGKFSTLIDEKTGTLVAELIDNKGAVVASGEKKIYQSLSDQHLASLEIQLDRRNEFTGTTVDFSRLMAQKTNSSAFLTKNIRPNMSVKANVYAASLDQQLSTDELGGFKISGITPDSTGLVRFESENYYPSIQTLSAEENPNIPLFSKKLIEAMQNIYKEKQQYSVVSENGSVVWGQVLLDGKPMAGVQVEALFNEEIKPIYLNGWLPDPKLEATTEGGHFIFMNLPAGLQTLIAKRGEDSYAHTNVVVDEGTASTAVLNHTLRSEVAELRAYEAFTGQPVQSEIDIQSQKESILVQGYTLLRLPNIKRQSFLQSRPRDADYMPCQMVYSEDQNEINIPHIRTSWLQGVLSSSRVSSPIHPGTILGFVFDEDYQVFLTHQEDFDTGNIIYFDSTGKKVDRGVSGGGFILQNVRPGIQSVVLVYEKSEQIHSQVIDVDPSAISTLLFHL